MTTIIIHATVLSRNSTEWQEFHCYRSGGNTHKKGDCWIINLIIKPLGKKSEQHTQKYKNMS